jgi:hypothetical protein
MSNDPLNREAFLMDLDHFGRLSENVDTFNQAEDVAERLRATDLALRHKVLELEAFIEGAKERLTLADRAIEMVHAIDSMLIRTPEDRQVPIEELLRRRIAGE